MAAREVFESTVDLFVLTVTKGEFQAAQKVIKRATRSEEMKQEHCLISAGSERTVLSFHYAEWGGFSTRARGPAKIALIRVSQSEINSAMESISQAALKPYVIAMVGTCVGNEKKVKLGDVLVPFQITKDSGKEDADGKHVSTTVEISFQLRPAIEYEANRDKFEWERFIPEDIKSKLSLSRLSEFGQSGNPVIRTGPVCSRVSENRDDPVIRTEPVCSGNKVSENRDEEMAQRSLAGYDNDGHSFLYSAEKILPHSRRLFVKGVSDLGTPQSKMDQEYCTASAMAFVCHLFEDKLFSKTFQQSPQRDDTSNSVRRRKEDDGLDAKVNGDEKREAALRIQSCWRKIGSILEPEPRFKDYDLEGFEEKKDGRDQAQAMLDAWTEKHHKKATRRCLIAAMKKEGLATRAYEVFPAASKKDLYSDSGHENAIMKKNSDSGSSTVVTIPEQATDMKADGGTLFLFKHTFKWCVLVFIVLAAAAGGAFLYASSLSGRDSSGERPPFPPSNSQESGNYLDRPVTRIERVKAAKRIRSYWRQVGRILGPKPFEEHELKVFEEKKKKSDQAQAMLHAWAKKYHKKATRRCLIEAMVKEGTLAAAAEIFSEPTAASTPECSFVEEPIHESPSEKADGGYSLLPGREKTSEGETLPVLPTNSASKLTGVTVSVNELVRAVVNFGPGQWLDIVLELYWKFQEAPNLETDHSNWARKKGPQKVLSDYQLKKGENESFCQQLIDVCSKVKIGDTLVLNVLQLLYTFSIFLLIYVIC